MVYIITILVTILGFPGPVLITVDEMGAEKLRFKTEESCRAHIKENKHLLQVWSASLFPAGTPIVSGSFTCREVENPNPGLSVFSDTPSKKI